MNNKTLVLNEKQLREKLLEGQKISSFEQLNLLKNDTPLSDGLKLLCSKGPSFVLVSPRYNWLQLPDNFDKFINSLKSRVFLPTKSKIVTKNSETRMKQTIYQKRNLIGQHQKQIRLNMRDFNLC